MAVPHLQADMACNGSKCEEKNPPASLFEIPQWGIMFGRLKESIFQPMKGAGL